MRFGKILCTVLLAVVAASGKAEEPELMAGVARVNLTPPLEWKYSLGGYGARMSKPAEGVHDWIWAKALVLTRGEKKYAVVTMDILGLPPTLKPHVVAALEGWSTGQILLLPSHSHASLDMSAINENNILNIPQIGIYQPQLRDFVVEKLIQVIRAAGRKLQPVRVGTASTVVNGMNRNRRGDGITDRELTVTRIDRQDGAPLAVLVNWTAHPTIMDEHDMWVSAGWPGYLQRELETWLGGEATVMYYNGAQGDQSPAGAVGGSHYEQAEDYGRRLAVRAFELCESMQTRSNPAFDYAYRVIDLPQPEAHPLFALTGGAEYGLDEGRMKVLLERMVPQQTASGAVRIGDLVIAGVPGEMIASLGMEIKNRLKEAGFAQPTIGGLANEWISYILSAEEYQEGGYEASVSFYGASLGKVITEGVLRAALQLAH